MIALRWTLIVVTALTGAGWILLVLWADSFRSSFGASPASGFMAGLPAAFLALILAALLLPELKWLQHIAAAAAAAAVVACLLLLRETVFVGSAGLVYVGLWLLYYWHSMRGAPTQPPG